MTNSRRDVDCGWHRHLIESLQYGELVHYINTTLLNSNRCIVYPEISTMQYLITIATLRQHYHHWDTRDVEVPELLILVLKTMVTYLRDNVRCEQLRGELCGFLDTFMSKQQGEDLVYGNKLLYEQLDGELWRLYRWYFANASSSGVKSQCITQSWQCVLEFFTDLISLQFDAVVQQDIPFEELAIAKLINGKDSTAIEEYITRVFLNDNTMSTDYIKPIYLRELTHNYKFIMTCTRELVNLGVDSIAIRRQMLFLCYRYINLTNDELVIEFFQLLQSFMVQMNYNELIEFFLLSESLSQEKVEFLGRVALQLLQCYSGKDLSKIDVIEYLHNTDFQLLASLQLEIDVLQSESFTQVYQSYQRIVLCWSVLTNLWFKCNSDVVDNWNRWREVILLLHNGDLERQLNLQKLFDERELNLTILEKYLIKDKLPSLKLNFIAKFGDAYTDDDEDYTEFVTAVEDSQ